MKILKVALFATTVVALAACQNGDNDKKGKSRLSRAGRSAQTFIKTNDQTNAQLCDLESKDKACRTLIVAVDENDEFNNQETKSPYFENSNYTVKSTETKTDDDSVTITAKNSAVNKGKKVQVIVVSAGKLRDDLKIDFEKALGSLTGKNQNVNALSSIEVDAATPDFTALNTAVSSTDDSSTIIAYVIGDRRLFTEFQKQFRSKQNTIVKLVSDKQISADQVAKEILDKSGEKLYLSYKLPHASNKIDLDSVSVTVAGKALDREKDFFVREADETLQIQKLSAFEKFTSEIVIKYDLKSN